jgi:hypothetical protein
MDYSSETPQSPPPLPPYNSGPFGGAYVEPPQRPKRKTAGTFLKVLLGLAVFCFFLIMGVTFLFSLLMNFLETERFDLPISHPDSSIALLRIEGPIYDRTRTMRIIEAYRKSDTTRGLVRIDSPGGSVRRQRKFRGLRI